MDGHLVGHLVAAKLLFPELGREAHRHVTVVTGIHSHNAGSQTRDRAILLQLNPEILATGIGRLEIRVGLGKRLALDGALVIEHREVTHCEGTPLDGLEIRQITTQSIEELLNLLFIDHRLLHGHLKSLVVREVHGGTGHDRRGESQGSVTLQAYVMDIGALDRSEFLLGERLTDGRIKKLAGHFLLDIRTILLLHDGQGRLPLAEAGKICQTAVFGTDLLPLGVEAIGRKLDVQVDDAGLFLFCGDFHDEQTSKAGSHPLDNPQRMGSGEFKDPSSLHTGLTG